MLVIPIKKAIELLVDYCFAPLSDLDFDNPNIVEDCVISKHMAIAAMEKQIPKRPLIDEPFTDSKAIVCPICGTIINRTHLFCCRCGQRIDWHGVDDD